MQRRLKRLRQTAIESEIAILSPEAIGPHLTIIIDVEFEDENSRLLHDFKTLMKSRPEVLQCYQTAGRTDFVVIVVVQDIEEYNTFAEACFLTNSNLKRYQTNVVLDRVKIGFQYPI
ncbi:MAG: Lrp/AsnC family transcriptional regulator [Rhodothermales bacterium]